MRKAIRLCVISLTIVGCVRPALALNATSLRRARHLVDKGQSALARGRVAHAEKLFHEAITIEPVLPTAYTGLAAALVEQKQFAQALTVAREAQQRFVEFQKKLQEARIKDWGLHNNAMSGARGLAAGGTQAPAIEKQLTTRRWTKVTKDPVPAEVFYLEGLCELRTRQRQQGIKDLKECLRRNPKHGLANYNLAVALFLGGDLQGAKQHLDRAVALGVKANPMFVRDLDARLAQR
ncbi:MAG: tetratricopeptide repeat protein [Acidobacteria bacterium]|nr:tetratricopeptide repeat protein [Acidobacteriota bacterium]